ncbi:MAG: NACHT domain-containing protein [Methylobacter sp.]
MNFQGFSPDSFEQFIRALSLKVIGPGVTVFGNGPDGGREATFQGKINFPFPPSTTWEGYGVLQAKFKEKIEDTQKDQKWAKSQLENELKVWISNNNRTPKPDYFIFCTNVELSSAVNGGKDAITQVFEDHKAAIGLKAYAIWDANQLKTYVDGYAEIRQRFECFFTPGDLLAAISKKLSNTANPDAILTAYLSKEILVDEDARLGQAGDRSEDRIRLAHVFMDLPITKASIVEPTEEDEFTEQLQPASLHNLLHAAANKLDPLALEEHRQASENGQFASQRIYGRFVFLGGPGSGKSTIGQFLAQIHRAALLDRREPHRVEFKVRNVIKDIKARCQEEQAIWPKTPRYPFRVELNAFAKELSKNTIKTLSEYLRRSLSQDLALSHEDLREWLRLFPWLLILDGLDEVPSSSNRREVVEAIQNFLNEARDVEADLMIVASSRPDGYAGEFDGDEVAHRYLAPLSKRRALACAQRYVDAKTASKGSQRATETMATLTDAANNPLIARLMRSPLQVTFMVTVVSASGKPSDSRWQLFNDYYRTIYERELHKAVPPFDTALNERRPDIDALHHRVGFILQCRAESSGGTQADLSITEFEQLVSECLEENGLPAHELETQKQMIIGAANQRLVFLTSRTPGRLSFDVRSLQEYMAAACLTNTDSNLIIQRLDDIAHSAYWRNTLLFAVGRFFVEPQMRDHRDKIRLLCEDLNLNGDNRAEAKLGSHLALEILESGTIGNMPRISQSLAKCALDLLANPPSKEIGLISRLANIYSPSVETEFQNQIDIWLGQHNLDRALSAWMLIFYLERKNILWVSQLIVKNWPERPEDSATILSAWLSSGLQINNLDAERLEKLIPQLPIVACENGILSQRIDAQLTTSEWLTPLTYWWKQTKHIKVKLYVDTHFSELTFKLNSVSQLNQEFDFQAIMSLGLEKELHSDWKLLIFLADFYRDPNVVSLSNVLEYFANSCEQKSWSFWAGKLPWPIKCHLVKASSKAELLLFVEQIRANLFGDFNQWKDKEAIWQENGINIDGLCNPLFKNGTTLLSAITSYGVSQAENVVARSVTTSMLDHLISSSSLDANNRLFHMLAFYGSCSGTLNCLDPKLLEAYLLPEKEYWGDRIFAVNLADMHSDFEQWINFYDHFGQLETLRFVDQQWRLDEAPLEAILQAFANNTARLGLLRLAGFWCASGRQANTEISTLKLLKSSKEPKYLLATMLVYMSRKDLSVMEASQIASHLSVAVSEKSEPNALHILLSAIEHHAKEISALEIVLKKLIELIPEDEWQLRARADVIRHTLLQARPSGFDNKKLTVLRLPLVEID